MQNAGLEFQCNIAGWCSSSAAWAYAPGVGAHWQDFFEGLRPDQVGLALPSGPKAAGSGFATTADINRALDCLTRQLNCATLTPSQAYPAFRGVMTWSINWDMNDGGIFSGPVGSHVHNLP